MTSGDDPFEDGQPFLFGAAQKESIGMAKRSYSNGEIHVLWDSDLCTHCEACRRGLPAVFNLAARPWINLAAASSAEIVEQVEKCPSGALTIAANE